MKMDSGNSNVQPQMERFTQEEEEILQQAKMLGNHGGRAGVGLLRQYFTSLHASGEHVMQTNPNSLISFVESWGSKHGSRAGMLATGIITQAANILLKYNSTIQLPTAGAAVMEYKAAEAIPLGWISPRKAATCLFLINSVTVQKLAEMNKLSVKRDSAGKRHYDPTEVAALREIIIGKLGGPLPAKAPRFPLASFLSLLTDSPQAPRVNRSPRPPPPPPPPSFSEQPSKERRPQQQPVRMLRTRDVPPGKFSPKQARAVITAAVRRKIRRYEMEKLMRTGAVGPLVLYRGVRLCDQAAVYAYVKNLQSQRKQDAHADKKQLSFPSPAAGTLDAAMAAWAGITLPSDVPAGATEWTVKKGQITSFVINGQRYRKD